MDLGRNVRTYRRFYGEITLSGDDRSEKRRPFWTIIGRKWEWGHTRKSAGAGHFCIHAHFETFKEEEKNLEIFRKIVKEVGI